MYGTIPTIADTSASALAAVNDDYAGSAPSTEVSLRWTNFQRTPITYLDVILNLRVTNFPVHAYAGSHDGLTCVHYVITPLKEARPAAGPVRGPLYVLKRFAVECEWHLHDTARPYRRHFFDRTPETVDEAQILATLRYDE